MIISCSGSVVKMAAARTCCNLARRVLLTQISKSRIALTSLAVRSRQISSLASHVPQLLIVSSKWTQPTRSYGNDFVNSVDELREMTMNVLKLFDKVDPTKVSPDAHFINDLGLDSLDVVEIVMAFEDEFGCEISDDEAEKIFTVNDAVELLKKKMDIEE